MNGHACRKVFTQAFKRGLIVLPSCCSKCERDDLPLKHFHKNFDKPLEVTWLCIECYKQAVKQRPGTFKGKHHTEDSKLSMSISHEGIEASNETRKKLRELKTGQSSFYPLVLTGKPQKGEIGLYKLYRRYSRTKKKVFLLTLEDFNQITQQNCFYCGEKPLRVSYKNGEDQAYIYNGIDRVDNTLGYIKENVVPCCTTCNKMKINYNQTFFIDHVKKIARHLTSTKE
jgi:hypothetical protein